MIVSLLFFMATSAVEPAHAQTQKVSRKPATLAGGHAKVSKTGIPLLPDGTPDYSKFPNPFVVQKWSFDLSAGSDKEYGIGANAHFYRWLAWRNLIFIRQASESSPQFFGVDSSERISYNHPLSKTFGLSIFAAPGFRLAGGGHAAPFAEAGAGVRIATVNISGGARKLLNSWIDTGGRDETQFFLSVSVLEWR